MKLFSFKKKKQPSFDAEKAKKEQRIAEVRRKQAEGGDAFHTGESEQKKTLAPIKKSSELAEAIIVRPRITEKATDIAEKDNAYAFEVAPHATKRQIIQAVRDLYNVTPTGVRIVQIPKKRVRGRRGEWGTSGGGKKAYVFLKKGDRIEFV